MVVSIVYQALTKFFVDSKRTLDLFVRRCVVHNVNLDASLSKSLHPIVVLIFFLSTPKIFATSLELPID
jgi:hypothetical protein